MDEGASLLEETGYRKPICRLTMHDKDSVCSALVDYHCMLKTKAAMDQFAEGLQELHIIDIIKQNPGALKPLFVADFRVLTAGAY